LQAPNLFCYRASVHMRHLDIENYDVRPPREVLGKCLYSISGRSNVVPVRIEEQHIRVHKFGSSSAISMRAAFPVDIEPPITTSTSSNYQTRMG
jgi:hypothetical protein